MCGWGGFQRQLNTTEPDLPQPQPTAPIRNVSSSSSTHHRSSRHATKAHTKQVKYKQKRWCSCVQSCAHSGRTPTPTPTQPPTHPHPLNTHSDHMLPGKNAEEQLEGSCRCALQSQHIFRVNQRRACLEFGCVCGSKPFIRPSLEWLLSKDFRQHLTASPPHCNRNGCNSRRGRA